MRSLLIAAAVLAAATTHAHTSLLNPPPAGFVELRAAIPTIGVEMRYGTDTNFTGVPLPGYGASGAWLLAPVAKALALVQQELAAQGLGLLVYDAYRPERATRAMVAWATRAGRVDLLDHGYVARKSGHNHGHTVDLTLVTLTDGRSLDMGTPWDSFDERSHAENATGDVLARRHVLRDTMMAHGFKPYAKEWWHFTFPVAGTRPRDVPYGCFEPGEGAFRAPRGWAETGWKQERSEPPARCPAR